MIKHTPGPWLVSEDGRDGMEWNRHIVSDPAHEMRICFMAHSDGKNPERDEANACLVAAAPDLLATLRAGRTKLATYVGVHRDDKELLALLGRWDAAIDKAEGLR